MTQIRNDNFITVQGWMVNELHLKGNELMVYAIIYGFSQDEESEFKGSRRYLASWLGCSLPTVDKALNGLIAKNLIIKTTYIENEIKFNRYRINLQGIKNLYGGCKESLQGCKESLLNNIDNNINKDNKTNSKELVQNSTPSSFLGSAKQKPKKESLYSKCINLIDDFTKNVKIRNLLIQYLNLRLEMKDKPMYTNQWKGLLNKLKELEKDNNIEDVITQSIEKGYASFYPVNKGYTSSNRNNFSEGDGLKCDSITEEELANVVQHKF